MLAARLDEIGSAISLPSLSRTSTSRRGPRSRTSRELTPTSRRAAAGPSGIDFTFAPVAGLWTSSVTVLVIASRVLLRAIARGGFPGTPGHTNAGTCENRDRVVLRDRHAPAADGTQRPRARSAFHDDPTARREADDPFVLDAHRRFPGVARGFGGRFADHTPGAVGNHPAAAQERPNPATFGVAAGPGAVECPLDRLGRPAGEPRGDDHELEVVAAGTGDPGDLTVAERQFIDASRASRTQDRAAPRVARREALRPPTGRGPDDDPAAATAALGGRLHGDPVAVSRQLRDQPAGREHDVRPPGQSAAARSSGEGTGNGESVAGRNLPAPSPSRAVTLSASLFATATSSLPSVLRSPTRRDDGAPGTAIGEPAARRKPPAPLPSMIESLGW